MTDERDVRAALRGDVAAALRWHESTPFGHDRPAALYKPHRLIETSVELPPPTRSARLGDCVLRLTAAPSNEGGVIDVEALCLNASFLDDDFRSELVYTVVAKWIAGSNQEEADPHSVDEGVMTFSPFRVAFLDPSSPGRVGRLDGTSDKYEREVVDILAPHVARFVSERARDIRRMAADELAMRSAELQSKVEDLRAVLEFTIRRLAVSAQNEIFVRERGWRVE